MFTRVQCKQGWLDIAELVDSFRLIPRSILLLYGYWMVYITDNLVHWYEYLPPIERTTQVTAVIGLIVPAVFGLAVWVYRIYTEGGRSWETGTPPNGSQNPTTLSQTTVVN